MTLPAGRSFFLTRPFHRTTRTAKTLYVEENDVVADVVTKT
jgi:hypothetical protein